MSRRAYQRDMSVEAMNRFRVNNPGEYAVFMERNAAIRAKREMKDRQYEKPTGSKGRRRLKETSLQCPFVLYLSQIAWLDEQAKAKGFNKSQVLRDLLTQVMDGTLRKVEPVATTPEMAIILAGRKI